MRIAQYILLALLVAGCLVASPLPAGEPAPQPTRTADLVEEYWPNGRLRLRKHVLTLEDGTSVNHGRFERWYDNGQKEYEAVFVLGKKEGTTIRFHRNGRKASEQEYRKGLRHGRSTSWNPAGEKVKEENWAEGKPHGTWTIWENGKVRWRNTFNHGVPAPVPEPPSSP